MLDRMLTGRAIQYLLAALINCLVEEFSPRCFDGFILVMLMVSSDVSLASWVRKDVRKLELTEDKVEMFIMSANLILTFRLCFSYH